jgi:hypothetical protein
LFIGGLRQVYRSTTPLISPKREWSDSALLYRIGALGGCGALCVCFDGIYADDSLVVSVVTCVRVVVCVLVLSDRVCWPSLRIAIITLCINASKLNAFLCFCEKIMLKLVTENKLSCLFCFLSTSLMCLSYTQTPLWYIPIYQLLSFFAC